MSISYHLAINHSQGGSVLMLEQLKPVHLPRKNKLLEAKERFEARNNGHKRFSEVKADYSNLDSWLPVWRGTCHLMGT